MNLSSLLTTFCACSAQRRLVQVVSLLVLSSTMALCLTRTPTSITAAPTTVHQATAQTNTGQNAEGQNNAEPKVAVQKNTDQKTTDQKTTERKLKNEKANPFSAEALVERAIFAYGTRPVLQNIQKNGIVRANVKFYTADGEREGRTVTKFIRREKLEEDLRLLDLDLPGTRYLLGYDGKQTWSINNGEIQEPAQETIKAFRTAHEHSYEALLRYKENGGKLELIGTNKVATIDLDIIELTLPSGVKTRYEVSRRTGRVIYIGYEEKPSAEAENIKYRLYFTDFRVMQGTLVPFGVKVSANDKVIEERRLVEVAYNTQLDEKSFLVENAQKSLTEPEKF